MASQQKNVQKTDEPSLLPRQFFGLKLGDALKFISSLLLPLALGVFTVVITFEQQNAAKQQRNEDRQAARLQLDLERNLNEQRYQNEAVDNYIKEIGQLLQKRKGSLTLDGVTASLARVKTLNVLRELDSRRSMRLIRFLYEAHQLSESNKSSPLDLSPAELRDIDFRRLSINKKKIKNLSLTGVFLKNATFTDMKLERVNFSTTEFENAYFLSNQLLNVDFSIARFNKTNFSYGKFRHVHFSSSSLFNVNISFGSLINTYFTLTELEHVDFSFTQLFNVSFAFARLDHVDFSFAQLYNVDFSSCLFLNTTFSNAKLIDVKFPTATLQNVNFRLAQFNYADFLNAQFFDVNFSSAIIASTEFSNSKVLNIDFCHVTSIAALFSDASLSNCNFCHANIKHASFDDVEFTDVNFFGANLYKADFTNSDLRDDALRNVLSIQDVILPNSTLFRDENLLNNVQSDCNLSFGSSWILKTGTVTAVLSNVNNDYCHFIVQSYTNGATMSQRVDLSSIWDSNLWPSSKAVLAANMSTGVSIHLTGVNTNNRHTVKQILTSNQKNISLFLENDMRELEVLINFDGLISNQTETRHYWCENIRLFIIYGTYLEFEQVRPIIPVDARWEQYGVTVAGGAEGVNTTNQFINARSLFVDNDQTLFIVDTSNGRIIQWKTNDVNGQVIAGDNRSGDKLNQLNYPTDLLIDRETNSLIICDQGNQRIMRWPLLHDNGQGEILIDNIGCDGLAMNDHKHIYVSENFEHEVRKYRMTDRDGTVVAGGHGKGIGLHQLFAPRHLFVDQQETIYVSDWGNHRIMRWNKGAKEGIIVAGGRGLGKSLTQLYYPHAIFVDTLDTIYITDMHNGRVIRWPAGAKQGTAILGGKAEGEQEETQAIWPISLSFDRKGNLYILSFWNNLVQKFTLE